MIDYSLPAPTEEELNLGSKVSYYDRLIEGGYHRKYKITLEELCDWIHHNYSAMFLLNEEISYNKYKKLIKR